MAFYVDYGEVVAHHADTEQHYHLVLCRSWTVGLKLCAAVEINTMRVI